MKADSDFDSDFDDERHDTPRDRVLGVLRFAAEAVLVVGAILVLYLAFRGPSGHPPAAAAPASAAAASPLSTYTAGARSAGQGAGARSATVPPATPTVTPPPASPRVAAPPPANPLSAQVQAYLAGRRGQVEVAIDDLSTGQQWTVGPQAPQAGAGVVGLDILAAMLNQQSTRRTVLSLSEQELSPPMIEQGDADAASTLWAGVGGAQGIRAFDHVAGLTHTSPSSCQRCSGFSGPGWALTRTTPQDQVTLLRQLVQPSRVLDKNDQKYALLLLENVMSSQRWGVSDGVPGGVTVALQNGAQPLNSGDSDWQVNSVGWVSGDGRNYLMSVLSTGDPSEQYGIDTLDHLGEMVWRGR
jgi:hypothetical protein